MPDLALKLRNPLAMFAPAYPEANIETKYKSPLVPLPTNAFIPQRDLDKIPVLEVSHLGIDFGGLTAVDDFNLTIGNGEITLAADIPTEVVVYNTLGVMVWRGEISQPTRIPLTKGTYIVNNKKISIN